MRLKHFRRMHLFVAEPSFAENLRFKNELYEILHPTPLNQNLWTFLINGHAQLFLLRKKNRVRLPRKGESAFPQKPAQLLRLFRTERMGVRVHKEFSLNTPSSRAFRHTLNRWFLRNKRDLPWRQTRDPYAILVSEIMLQQTQVATVIPYYHEWLRRFPDFASLADACENDVLRGWQGLGYYVRARNLHATASTVVDRY